MKNTKVVHKIFFVVVITLLLVKTSPITAAVTQNTTFNVNVQEFLSVSITTPTEWASGAASTFLRNKVNLTVESNNPGGFTASMTTKTTETALINTSKSTETLPRLTSSQVVRGAFPSNQWGYSTTDSEAGNSSSYYKPVPSFTETPATILTNAQGNSKDFYFGAKFANDKAAGTYVGTVVISVVTGVIDDNTNPVTPVNPVNPSNEETPAYDSGRNTTAYTYRRTGNGGTSSTTTTEITSGDNRSAYENYTPPQGVTYSTASKIGTGVTIATGLGIAASIAATSGYFFLAAARREGEDDDEDDELY